MSGLLDDPAFDAPARLTARAVPLSGGERTVWRVSAVVLVLGRCRGKQTSVAAVHTLVWALQNDRTRSAFRAWWEGRRFASVSTVRFDPVTDLAISAAATDGLVEVKASGRIRLTDAGSRLNQAITSEAGILVIEKQFLHELPAGLAESEIERRMGWR